MGNTSAILATLAPLPPPSRHPHVHLARKPGDPQPARVRIQPASLFGIRYRPNRPRVVRVRFLRAPTGAPLDAADGPDAEVEERGHRPGGFFQVHLALPGPAVLENDRRLAQSAPGQLAAVQHLLLERIPAGDHAVEPHVP